MRKLSLITTLSFLMIFCLGASAYAMTLEEDLSITGSIYNPQASVNFADNLDINGYVTNTAGHFIIEDDLEVNGKLISNLHQIYKGVTDYRGTIYNSTAAVTIGDDLRVDGTISRGYGDVKIADSIQLQGDLIPTADKTYSLGNGKNYWKYAYIDNLKANTFNPVDITYSGVLTGPVANFTSTLTAAGLTTLDGGVAADGGVFTVADASGDVHTGGTLDVDGATTLGGTLSVTGDTNLDSNLVLAGNGDVQGNLWNSTGSLHLNDNVNVWGTIENSFAKLTLDDDVEITGSGDFQNYIYNSSANPLEVNDTFLVSGNYASTFTGTSDLRGTIYNTEIDGANKLVFGDDLLPNGSTYQIGNGSNPWQSIWLNSSAVIRDAGTGSAQHSASFGFVSNTTTNENTSYTTQYYRVDNGTLGADESRLWANGLSVTDGINTSTYGVNANVQGIVTANIFRESMLEISNGGIYHRGGGGPPPVIDIGINKVGADFSETITIGDLGYNDTINMLGTINIGGGPGNDVITLAGGGGTDSIQANASLNMGLNNITNVGHITAAGTIQGATITDGSASLTGGVLSSATGLISQWTNDTGYIPAATFAANGDLLVGSGAGTYAALTAGAGNNGNVLTVVGGTPVWQVPVAGAEVDPVVGALTGIIIADGAGNISSIINNSANWNTAFGWGDHSVPGYITASSTDTLTNKSGNISMWTNDASYLTSYTETDPLAVLKSTFAANGDLLVGSGAGTYAALIAGAGNNGNVLTVIGGTPTWQTPAAGSVGYYGEMYQDNNSATTTINTVNTYEEIDNFTTGLKSGWLFGGNGDLTADTGSDGTYGLTYSVSSSLPSGTNKNFEYTISKNDTPQTNCNSQRFYATNDTGTSGGTCLLSIVATDVIKLEVRNLTDTANVTIKDANVNLTQI